MPRAGFLEAGEVDLQDPYEALVFRSASLSTDKSVAFLIIGYKCALPFDFLVNQV